MEKLSKILPKVLQSHSLQSSARSSVVCEEFKRFFVKNWGEENLCEILSMKFKNGRIIVNLKNAVWSHQIYLKKEEFLNIAKKVFVNTNILDVVTKIGE